MFKKMIVSVLLLGSVLFSSGCRPLWIGATAGAVGGVGTAMWLGGKLTQQFEAPYQKTVSAVESALAALKLPIDNQVMKAEVTTFRSRYTNGKKIWIDVRLVSETTTKVEVRVGRFSADKEAAAEILNKVESFL